MTYFNKLTLRTKLLILSVFTLIVVAGGSWYSLNQISGSYHDYLMGDFKGYASDLNSMIGAQFYERYGDVQAFAANEAIKSGDPVRMQEPLNAYIGLYGLYDLILVVDKKGRYVASNQADISGKKIDTASLSKMNFSEQPWFKAVLNNQFTEDKENGFTGTFFEDYVLDPIMKSAVGEDRYDSGFSTAIKNDKGETVGIITNRANEKWVVNEVKNQMKFFSDHGYKTAEIVLFNKTGLVIEHINGKGSIPDTKLKENFLDGQSHFAKLASEGQSGSGVNYNETRKEEVVVGYSHVEDPKWIKAIGWNVLIRESTNNVFVTLTQARNQFLVFFIFAAFLALTISVWMSVGLTKRFSALTGDLNTNSKEVNSASIKIATLATTLSESATEQAAALQETVAAVDEISAMVEKNAEAASRSKNVSAESREAAQKGRQIVDDMLNSINEIDQANTQISTQMEQSNRELSEITKLITDIGTKTKVINEIVFQTKLLSFNASVEAARAGEYGKGFSVVAEEVGNLAQMSGNAAKEITVLLEESIRKVETIASESKLRIEKLMEQSKEKVQMGSKTARDCNSALEEILSNVESVDSLVAEIAVASQEQSTGIREISKAVGQMEQVTQQNSTVAQNSSASAEQLHSQAAGLDQIVQQLFAEVQGSDAKLTEENLTPIIDLRAKKEIRKSASLKAKKSKPTIAATDSPTHGETFKKAVGSDYVPSGDEPGFQD